jgi:hypothetical protein
MDIGVIKRLRNPFAHEKHALIAAGSYGYGTWAAPVLMRTKAFLDHPVIRSYVPFECLFSVPVVAGRPEDARIHAVYPMHADAHLHEARTALNESPGGGRPAEG